MLVDGRRGRFLSRCRVATASAVLAFAVVAPAAGLESVTGDRTVTVREHAGWNMDCNAIAAPPLFLIKPPSHGKVCAKAQMITIASVQDGTESQCVGRDVSGVRLIYMSDRSHNGVDVLVYGVQYPSRFQAISVKVDIGGAAPAKVSIEDAPQAGQPRQMPGPMPVCPQPVF